LAELERIPTWHVRPGLEVGVKVTLRGQEAEEMLKKILPAINSTVKEKQIQNNFFSFGVHEYIEIPGVEYIREVGIMGFEVTVVFSRAGKRVEKKKAKGGKTKRQLVAKEEIKKILRNKFDVEIIERRKK
jgi:large subunit ribosomal protein L5